MVEKAWGIASYSLVGTGIISVAGYVAWRSGAEFGDIAGWVQAVGSMVAIWGAFAISRSQTLHDAHARAEANAQAERDQANAVLSILVEIHAVSRKTVESARECVEAGEPAKFRPALSRRITERLLAHLSTVPMHSMPYAKMARPLVMATTAVEHFLDIADELRDADIERAKKQLARLHRYLDFIKTGTTFARRNAFGDAAEAQCDES